MSKISPIFENMINSIHDYRKKSPWKDYYEYHFAFYMHYLSESMKLTPDEFLKTAEKKDENILNMVSGIITETFMEEEFGNNHENITLDYLKRRKWKLSKDAIHCWEQMQYRSFSIYEVIDVKPDEGIIIKDILLNTKEIFVEEISGSRYAQPFDLLVAKVIELEGNYYLTGLSFKISRSVAEKIKKLVRKDLKAKNLNLKNNEITPKELCPEVNGILRKYTAGLFLTGINSIFNPPDILNYEGDKFSLIEIKFSVKDKKEVEKRLDKFADLDRIEGEDSWDWIGPKIERKKGGENLVFFAQNMEGNLIHGRLDIEGDYLVCQVFSEYRAKKLTAALLKFLGDVISLPVIEQKDLLGKDKKSEKVREVPTQLEMEIGCKFFIEHIKESLDEKIPVLNNKTPRQCAKTDPKRLIKWLENMEESAERQGCDISWVWDELGIKKPD